MKQFIFILTLTLIVSVLVYTSCENVKSDEDLIRQLFHKETALKNSEDISPLNTIYSATAVIYDGQGTPDTSDDSLFLDGIGEITGYYQWLFEVAENIQHTYTITDVVINDNLATCNKTSGGSHVITATKEVFYLPGGAEPWKLQKINNDWFVIEATWFTQ